MGRLDKVILLKMDTKNVQRFLHFLKNYTEFECLVSRRMRTTTEQELDFLELGQYIETIDIENIDIENIDIDLLDCV